MARKKRELVFTKDEDKFVDFLNFNVNGKSLGTKSKGQAAKEFRF